MGSANRKERHSAAIHCGLDGPPKAFVFLMMHFCLVSLGSNLGNRSENLHTAIARLAAHPDISALRHSEWHETSPIGGPADQDDYLNAAVAFETSLAPDKLLALLQQIELQLGRRRETHWGPRTIDLDLLIFGQTVLATPTLVLPHPRMAWRRFVLEPAAEVAPDLVHPTIGWTVARLLDHLNRSTPYIAVTGPIAAGKTLLATRLADAIPAQLILEQPDWTRLGDFYADPTALAWQTELDFLAEREKKLDSSAFSAQNPSDPRYWVSDFWFDQSAAFARVWLPADRLAEYVERYEQSRRAVEPPRLLVLLDAPADQLLDRIHQRARPCERPLAIDALQRIRREVLDACHRPGLGPVLRAVGNPDEVFAEVLAAVRAME